MALMTREIEALIGARSGVEKACEAVERGAVRRFVQACMDDGALFQGGGGAEPSRYGGPVAPPLFPMNMFRTPFGAPDPFASLAESPDFDGIIGSTAQGLPPLPLPEGIGLLNGGTEVEVYRYALHGEEVTAQSRYASIVEKESSKGPMLIVVIEIDYRNDSGELLLRVKKTQIRR